MLLERLINAFKDLAASAKQKISQCRWTTQDQNDDRKQTYRNIIYTVIFMVNVALYLLASPSLSALCFDASKMQHK